MGQQDMSEKLLEDYNDVFADIVNVLLFDGKELVKPEELADAQPYSQYKADDGKLHEQERDVAKYWRKGNMTIALCGIENQTRVDNEMPFRIINYDGAAYRSQTMKKDGSPKHYPVVTLVLYFGEQEWNGPRKLSEGMDIPEEVKPYFQDYGINLFSICHLEESIIRKFKSDFGIVADYFAGFYKDREYRPKDERKFRHIDAMLKFLAVVKRDERYVKEDFRNEKGEVGMCEILDRMEEKGIAKGIEQGIEKGTQNTLLDSLCNVMNGFKVSEKEAMDVLKISEADRPFYHEALKKYRK